MQRKFYQSIIYTTINTAYEFMNVSVTEVGVAGWAWSTHA